MLRISDGELPEDVRGIIGQQKKHITFVVCFFL